MTKQGPDAALVFERKPIACPVGGNIHFDSQPANINNTYARHRLVSVMKKRCVNEIISSSLTKTTLFWENVMWTDETKVELFGEAHYCTVYRKRN